MKVFTLFLKHSAITHLIDYSVVEIFTFISTGKPKNSCHSLYCHICFLEIIAFLRWWETRPAVSSMYVCICLSHYFQFFWVCNQKWNCWIKLSFCVQYFEKPPYHFPQQLHNFIFLPAMLKGLISLQSHQHLLFSVLLMIAIQMVFHSVYFVSSLTQRK